MDTLISCYKCGKLFVAKGLTNEAPIHNDHNGKYCFGSGCYGTNLAAVTDEEVGEVKE